ncbi:MAG: VOC family protein [Candidatus Acidiferrales bacterium]
MASPQAVLESSLYVKDLDRAVAFYRHVLGLRLIDEFQEGRGAAFMVGPTILLLFEAAKTRAKQHFPSHGAEGQGHVAFRVEPSELEDWRRRLKEHKVAIEKELAFGDQPPSIYFRDPDGNLLELAVAAIWPFEKT